MTKEQPRGSKGRVYFNEIRKNIRINHDLPMHEPNPNDRMDTDEDNEIESTNSSKMNLPLISSICLLMIINLMM